MQMGEWTANAQKVANETAAALQTMYDALNQGQGKQVVKNQEVKALFDRYGVTYSD